MKKTLKERAAAFFIDMGKRSRLLRPIAICGLAVSFLLCGFLDYLRRGTKRFACAVFILLCFMVGNSFAYPVFFKEAGAFSSGQESPAAVTVSEDSNIRLAATEELALDDVPLLEDEDVWDAAYVDIEHQGMAEADILSSEDILAQNEDILNALEEQDKSEEEALQEETESSPREFSPDDWKLVLVNKQHPIPDDYQVFLGTIRTTKGNEKCDERIIEDLLMMLQASRRDGMNLAVSSPYRDFNRQTYLFNRKINAYMSRGMSYMEAYSVSSQTVTVPGASEHQIGLALDIAADDYVSLDQGFADTDEGKWLAQHSYEYGFILRYPEGKEYITSIEYEPWHFRYVGREAAAVIYEEQITLEEFWDKYL